MSEKHCTRGPRCQAKTHLRRCKRKPPPSAEESLASIAASVGLLAAVFCIPRLMALEPKKGEE